MFGRHTSWLIARTLRRKLLMWYGTRTHMCISPPLFRPSIYFMDAVQKKRDAYVAGVKLPQGLTESFCCNGVTNATPITQRSPGYRVTGYFRNAHEGDINDTRRTSTCFYILQHICSTVEGSTKHLQACWMILSGTVLSRSTGSAANQTEACSNLDSDVAPM